MRRERGRWWGTVGCRRYQLRIVLCKRVSQRSHQRRVSGTMCTCDLVFRVVGGNSTGFRSFLTRGGLNSASLGLWGADSTGISTGVFISSRVEHQLVVFRPCPVPTPGCKAGWRPFRLWRGGERNALQSPQNPSGSSS